MKKRISMNMIYLFINRIMWHWVNPILERRNFLKLTCCVYIRQMSDIADFIFNDYLSLFLVCMLYVQYVYNMEVVWMLCISIKSVKMLGFLLSIKWMTEWIFNEHYEHQYGPGHWTSRTKYEIPPTVSNDLVFCVHSRAPGQWPLWFLREPQDQSVGE